MLVAERDDLALYSRAERAQQDAELDAHLEPFLGDGHGAGRTDSLEAEIVALPGEGPAVVLSQLPRDRLGEAPGPRQSQGMLPTNDDRRHRSALCAPTYHPDASAPSRRLSQSSSRDSGSRARRRDNARRADSAP